jgi:hypothetical protein
MHTRIAQYWKDLDMLLESSSAQAVAEPQRLASCPVNAEQPLEIFLDTCYLLAVVKVSISSMRRHLRDLGKHNAATHEHLEREVARREAFLRWLEADGGSRCT